MNGSHVRKLVVAAMFVALAVTLSTLSFPVGASRCFPVQHMVNVLSAVLLGPGYGVAVAFCTSLIRNLLGTGTLLAFPGSMIGALCCGLMYKYTKRLLPTYIAEVVGTGVLGGLAAYPVAAYLMGREGAIYAYILPFFISTFGGTLLASILIGVLYKCGALRLMQEKIGDRISQAATR